MTIPIRSLDSSTYCWWKKSCTAWEVWNAANNRNNCLSTGAGFLHQQYESKVTYHRLDFSRRLVPDKQKALREIGRVLRAGGHAFVSVPFDQFIEEVMLFLQHVEHLPYLTEASLRGTRFSFPWGYLGRKRVVVVRGLYIMSNWIFCSQHWETRIETRYSSYFPPLVPYNMSTVLLVWSMCAGMRWQRVSKMLRKRQWKRHWGVEEESLFYLICDGLKQLLMVQKSQTPTGDV